MNQINNLIINMSINIVSKLNDIIIGWGVNPCIIVGKQKGGLANRPK